MTLFIGLEDFSAISFQYKTKIPLLALNL